MQGSQKWMLEGELKRDGEVEPEMDDGEGAEVDACLVEQVPLPVMTISRSRSILKREPRFEGSLERHMIKETGPMCERWIVGV